MDQIYDIVAPARRATSCKSTGLLSSLYLAFELNSEICIVVLRF